MLVTVKKQEYGSLTAKNGQQYTGYHLEVIKPDGKDKKYFIPDFKIKKEPDLASVSDLVEGEQVVLKMVKEGQNWVLKAISKNEGDIASAQQTKFSGGGRKYTPSSGVDRVSDKERQESIERQAAMKCSTELVVAIINSGVDLSCPETELVKKLAKELLKFHDEIKNQ